MLEFFADLDEAASAWFVAIRTKEMTGFFQRVTNLGSIEGILLISIIILMFLGLRRNWPHFKFIFFTIGGGELLNESSKWLIHRNRPPLPWFTSAHGFSFPSGHTLMSTIFYVLLTWLIYRHFQPSTKRSVIIAFFLAIPVLVGISRIYLGVHFLTDVIGGWFFGILWVGCAIASWQKATPKV